MRIPTSKLTSICWFINDRCELTQPELIFTIRLMHDYFIQMNSKTALHISRIDLNRKKGGGFIWAVWVPPKYSS